MITHYFFADKPISRSFIFAPSFENQGRCWVVNTLFRSTHCATIMSYYHTDIGAYPDTSMTGTDINGRLPPTYNDITQMDIGDSSEMFPLANSGSTAKLFPNIFKDGSERHLVKNTVVFTAVDRPTLERNHCFSLGTINQSLREKHTEWILNGFKYYKATKHFTVKFADWKTKNKTKIGSMSPSEILNLFETECFNNMSEREFFARDYTMQRILTVDHTRPSIAGLLDGNGDCDLLIGENSMFHGLLKLNSVYGVMSTFALPGVISGDATSVGTTSNSANGVTGPFSIAMIVNRFGRCLDYWGPENGGNSLSSHVGFQVIRTPGEHGKPGHLQITQWSSCGTSPEPSGAEAWTLDINGNVCRAGYFYLGCIVEPPAKNIDPGTIREIYTAALASRSFDLVAASLRGDHILALDIKNNYNYFTPHM